MTFSAPEEKENYSCVFFLQVSKKNLMEIVKKLMLHVDKAEGTTYRDELLTKIIDICSQSNYQYITNFEWSVLLNNNDSSSICSIPPNFVNFVFYSVA